MFFCYFIIETTFISWYIFVSAIQLVRSVVVARLGGGGGCGGGVRLTESGDKARNGEGAEGEASMN